MKKILYLAIAFAFGTILSVACDKINDSTKNEQQDNTVVKTVEPHVFTLKIDNPNPSHLSSRVSINGTTGKTSWEPNDQIFIHGEKVGVDGAEIYSTVVTLTAEDIDDLDPSIATIKITDDMTYMPYTNRYLTTLWAAYPASAVENFNDGDSWYYWNRFKNTNAPLMTGFNNLNVNDGNTFKFYNLCGVISFIVDGDYDSYIFTGNNSEVVGYSGYQCRVHVYDNYNSSKTSGFEEKNVWNDTSNSYPKGAKNSIEVEGWDGADGTKVNYISVPNGASFPNGFTIQFLKNGFITGYVTSSQALNLTRSSVLPLGDITSKVKPYVDPKHITTITPSNYPSSFVTDAPGSLMTIDGIDFYALNARKKSSGVDVELNNNVDVSVYNSTALDQVTKIVINKAPGYTMYNSFTVYCGTSANPTTGTVIDGVTTPYDGGGYSKITYDLSSGSYTHFAITYTSAYYGYYGDIEVTYLVN